MMTGARDFLADAAFPTILPPPSLLRTCRQRMTTAADFRLGTKPAAAPDKLTAPLFVPADRPERFAKAVASGADAVILDLEDAVAPVAKDGARSALLASLPAATVVIRVNAVGTPWHSADVALLDTIPAAGAMLPKAEDPAAIADLARRLGEGRTLIPLIETARGLHHAAAIAAIPSVTQLAFGPADYRNDIGCDDTPEALLLARSMLVLASRLGGLAAPLDGPCFDFRDPAATTAEARHAKALGFGGKLCIHPAQVPVVRAAFRPSAAEIDWARHVVAASRDGAAAGLDGSMIDAPVLARARRLLADAGEPA
jgi:citrate lyase subunit beta / citryl-CoA lyase